MKPTRQRNRDAQIRADERQRIADRLRDGARQTEIIGEGLAALGSEAGRLRAEALANCLRQVAGSVEKDCV